MYDTATTTITSSYYDYRGTSQLINSNAVPICIVLNQYYNTVYSLNVNVFCGEKIVSTQHILLYQVYRYIE